MIDGGNLKMQEDMMGLLKGLLGDNAEEKIKNIMDTVKGNENLSQMVENSINTAVTNPFPVVSDKQNNSFNDNDNLESILKIKNIINEIGNSNDPRSNLLMSLKPYMRSTRQKSIDNAIKILNLSKYSGLFKL